MIDPKLIQQKIRDRMPLTQEEWDWIPQAWETLAVKPKSMIAYLVLITWPNGTEGLLFPRPGNVPICDNQEQGEADFAKAKQDLVQHVEQRTGRPPGRFTDLKGTTIRLVQFERGPSLQEFVL